MNPIVRNVLAVIAGVFAGWIANMGLIMLSGSIIPPPEGVNPADMESIKENFHLFEAKHYIFPFLAHAMGSFFGALVAALIAVSNKMKFAIGLGLFTMLGGIAACFLILSPTWFIVTDLALAYIPFAYLAGRIAERK